MFEDLQRRFIPKIDQAYAQSLQELLPDSFHPVREMLVYHYNTGGKRLRPLCVFVAAEAFRARLPSLASEESFVAHVLPYATAVEMIHNATLIHDDIQDGDEVRRNQPTLWKRNSVAQAINCGDLLFFLPQRMVQHAPYSPELKLKLLEVLQERTTEVIVGQTEEFVLKERLVQQGVFPSLRNYEQMAKGKTAALFELPLVGGAVLAQASREECEALGKASAALGLAFQIQDDLLDLWGKKGRQQSGSDIAEGKLSYLVVQANELLMKAKRFSDLERLKKILIKSRAETSREDIAWATELLEHCGARKAALERFERCLEEAKQPGEVGRISESIGSELRALLSF